MNDLKIFLNIRNSICSNPRNKDSLPYKYEIEMLKNNEFNPNLIEDILKQKYNTTSNFTVILKLYLN